MSLIPAPVISQDIMPLPPGAKGIMNAGFIKAEQQSQMQNSLINSVSGGSRSKKWKGGAGSYIVPQAPSYSLNPTFTNSTYKALTELAVNQQAQSAYDSCVGLGPSCTASILKQQTGGKKNSHKRKNTRTKRNHKKYNLSKKISKHKYSHIHKQKKSKTKKHRRHQ